MPDDLYRDLLAARGRSGKPLSRLFIDLCTRPSLSQDEIDAIRSLREFTVVSDGRFRELQALLRRLPEF